MGLSLKITDGSSLIDFTGGGDYQLLDGSFSAPPPAMASANGGYFGVTREVVFSYRIVGTSESDAIEKYNVVERIIGNANNQMNASGASVSGGFTFDSGNETGDGGVHLTLENGSNSSIIDDGGNSVNAPEVFTMRILSASQTVSSPFSVSGISNSDAQSVISRIDIVLTCAPFTLGRSRRVLLDTAGSESGLVSPYEAGAKNFVQVPGSSIPGAVDAVTRITTRITYGDGIIMGRDYGTSIIHCASYPSGPGDVMIAKAYNTATNVNSYEVRVEGSPTQSFRWKVNGGAWSALTAITTNAFQPINSGLAEVMFFRNTGMTNLGIWTFYDAQRMFDVSGSFSLSTQSNLDYFNSFNLNIATFDISIPSHIVGKKYRVFIDMGGTAEQLLLKMNVRFSGYGEVSASGSYYPDVVMRRNINAIDLGLIDFSPSVLPASQHPSPHLHATVRVFAGRLLTDEPTGILQPSYVYLIPSSDVDSFMNITWGVDREGEEVYCNYDYDNPYYGETPVPIEEHFNSGSDVSFVGFDYSVDGRAITLKPGLDNTIVMIPTFRGVSTIDYREVTIGDATTNNVSVFARPRYTFIG